MGISKIYVNNALKIDLTKTTATAEDVAAGKEFYNKQGDLITGNYTPPTLPTPPTSSGIDFSYDGSFNFSLDISNTSLSMPGFLCDYYGPWQYVNYDISINKDSFISNDDCYSSETNYGSIKFYCTEPMTYEDVWSCLDDPSCSSDYGSGSNGRWISGIIEITGQIEESEDLVLPSWSWIPKYCIQLYVSAFNKVILPATVSYVESVGNSGYILKCLSETPPECDYSVPSEVSYIEVPEGCKDAYIGADNWGAFSYKIYETGEELPEY